MTLPSGRLPEDADRDPGIVAELAALPVLPGLHRRYRAAMFLPVPDQQEQSMDTITAGRYILDSMQRLQMGDSTPDEYRACMAYVQERTDDATYAKAKMWACARDAR